MGLVTCRMVVTDGTLISESIIQNLFKVNTEQLLVNNI